MLALNCNPFLLANLSDYSNFALIRKTNLPDLRNSVITCYLLLVVSSYEKDNFKYCVVTDCNRFIRKGRNNECL